MDSETDNYRFSQNSKENIRSYIFQKKRGTGQRQNIGMLEFFFFFNLENICTRTRGTSHLTTHCHYVLSLPQDKSNCKKMAQMN